MKRVKLLFSAVTKSKNLTIIQHVGKWIPRQLEQIITSSCSCSRSWRWCTAPSWRSLHSKQVQDVWRLLRPSTSGSSCEGVGGAGGGSELLHGSGLLLHQLLGCPLVNVASIGGCTSKCTENKISNQEQFLNTVVSIRI